MKFNFMVILLLTIHSIDAYSLVINEMMSSNQITIADEDGDYSDWIEIYNPSEFSINLLGYNLSDKSSNLSKWTFPDTIIQPRAFMLVFASGKDRRIAGKELHTNFSISAEGEKLSLSKNNKIIHSVPKIALKQDISFGLSSDGTGNFVMFREPSPNATNNFSAHYFNLKVSKQGGIYPTCFSVELKIDVQNADIYYTIDGSRPTIESIKYDKPINIDSNLFSPNNISQLQLSPDDLYFAPDTNDVPKIVVLRAAAFDKDSKLISDIVTNSYIIKELGTSHDLPVVSICADYDSFFDFEKGILVPGVNWKESNPYWTGNYHQRGELWERNISVEFYEQNNKGFKQDAGIRVHGGSSRRIDQKCMKIYARNDYGKSRFDYPIFKNHLDSYKRLVLRPFTAPYSRTGMNDHISHEIARTTKSDALASRPVVLYLNGEYWGIYYIQERIDDIYISDNFDIPLDSIDLVSYWGGSIMAGSNIDYYDLYGYIKNNDLSIDDNYKIVEQWMDIDNFIDYQLLEIFIANLDWPVNNMKCWRDAREGGKWRWIFFDGDLALYYAGFKGFDNALDSSDNAWPSNARSTLFLRKLLKNEIFYAKFINRIEQLLNNEFNISRTLPYFESAQKEIDSEIERQTKRFEFISSYDSWIHRSEGLKTFLEDRSCIVVRQADTLFNQHFEVWNCIEENYSSKMNVFPNPNNGNFNLFFHLDTSSNTTLKIHDVSGSLVYETNINSIEGFNAHTINISGLKKGLYFISIIADDIILNSKFLCY